MLRLMSYNIEWFGKCFTAQNGLDPSEDAREQLAAVAEVIRATDADLIGITEAPNTTTTTGERDTIEALENFAAEMGLRQSEALIGYASPGAQEIAILYDPAVVSVSHDPGGVEGTVRNPTFREEFQCDSDGDGIRELYRHYRPPLEARVTRADGGAEFWMIVAHAKSKGIFSAMDKVHFDRTSERNRRKLFAEASSIRQRVDDWLDQNRPVVVMGDINDGAGFDYYEARFGRSAVEVIMGDLFAPERLLRNVIGRPKWGRSGWEPSSVRFTDAYTGDRIGALIDHIMLSLDLPPRPGSALVWNPRNSHAPDEVKALRKALGTASDHYPITVDID